MKEVVLRPARADDEGLLFAVFRADRAFEFAALGLPAEALEPLLRSQWDAERRSRAAEFPAASHRVVVVGDRAIGRLLVDVGREALRVVDVALLPDARGSGVGTAVLERVLDEARGARLPVTLSVRRGNPAERLYRRLGFTVTREGAMDLEMRRPADVAAPEGARGQG